MNQSGFQQIIREYLPRCPISKLKQAHGQGRVNQTLVAVGAVVGGEFELIQYGSHENGTPVV